MNQKIFIIKNIYHPSSSSLLSSYFNQRLNLLIIIWTIILYSFIFKLDLVLSSDHNLFNDQNVDETTDSTITTTATNESIVNCRCGLKPWKNRDTDSEEPTRDCCQYFIQSRQGNFSEQTFSCQIHNELIYKRFHSCCITLLQSAYCSQTRIKSGAANKLTTIRQRRQQQQKKSRINYDLIQWPKFRSFLNTRFSK